MMEGRDAEGPRTSETRDRRSPTSRDDVLAKKRARVELISRLDRHSSGEVSALRLLAEVDLALSEHRRQG